jgi:hypothetical protein
LKEEARSRTDRHVEGKTGLLVVGMKAQWGYLGRGHSRRWAEVSEVNNHKQNHPLNGILRNN